MGDTILDNTMYLSEYDTWVGLGGKVGGSLGLIGAESADGYVWNVGYQQHVHPLNITSFRFGPGLGGGVGMVAMLVFNCGNIASLNNTSNSDWCINVSLAGKWSSLVKGLQKYKFFTALAKYMDNTMTPDDMSSVRNGLSYLYSAAEINNMDYSPKTVTLDIPAAGIGVELSMSYMLGIVTVGEIIVKKDAEQSEGQTFDGSGSGSSMEY